MAELIAQNLWRLDVPLPGNPLKNLNSYLITGERSLLIDTGFRWEACRDALTRQLAELGVDRERLDFFATHLHSDHVGLIPELLYPGSRVYISECDHRGVMDYMDEAVWRELHAEYVANGFLPEEMERLWEDNPAKMAAPLEWKQCRSVRDGEVLSYGGYSLRAILTPGHTPGHMCLYEPDRQWIFSGDHVLFDISPNICRWTAMPNALGSYLESLKKVRDLPVDRAFPAHRATGDWQPRVEELLEHHLRRIENAWQTVRDEPGQNACEIAGQMRWKIRSRSWADFPLTQKFFAVGEALAHLDYLEVRGRVVRRNGNRYYVTDEGETKYGTKTDSGKM